MTKMHYWWRWFSLNLNIFFIGSHKVHFLLNLQGLFWHFFCYSTAKKGYGDVVQFCSKNSCIVVVGKVGVEPRLHDKVYLGRGVAGQPLHVNLQLPLSHVLLHPLEEGEHGIRAGQSFLGRRLGEMWARHAEGVGHTLQRRDGVLVCCVVTRVDDPDPGGKRQINKIKEASPSNYLCEVNAPNVQISRAFPRLL